MKTICIFQIGFSVCGIAYRIDQQNFDTMWMPLVFLVIGLAGLNVFGKESA